VPDPLLLAFQEEGVPLPGHEFDDDLHSSDTPSEFMKVDTENPLVGASLHTYHMGGKRAGVFRWVLGGVEIHPPLLRMEGPPQGAGPKVESQLSVLPAEAVATDPSPAQEGFQLLGHCSGEGGVPDHRHKMESRGGPWGKEGRGMGVGATTKGGFDTLTGPP